LPELLNIPGPGEPASHADYRDVAGVKVPFRWTLSRPNGRFTIQIAEAKANVDVDDARFAKPIAETK